MNVCRLLTIATIFLTELSFAAPHPGLSTSLLLNKKSGIYLLPYGFKISLSDQWTVQVRPSKDDPTTILEAFLSERGWPRLMITKNEISNNSSIESYTKKWIQNYSNYGFQIESQKIFQLNGKKAIAIDLTEMKSKTMARQYIQINEKNVLIITCSDKQENFRTAIETCNSLVQTLEWTPKSL